MGLEVAFIRLVSSELVTSAGPGLQWGACEEQQRGGLSAVGQSAVETAETGGRIGGWLDPRRPGGGGQELPRQEGQAICVCFCLAGHCLRVLNVVLMHWKRKRREKAEDWTCRRG